MAEPPKLRHRRRMKQKEIEPVLAVLRDGFGMPVPADESAVDGAEADHLPVFLVDNEVIAAVWEEKTAPTLRGLLKWPATKRWVTVDMGAIKFVTNGADVMAPGIREAEPGIVAGDPVWVRDERHGKPLAVGIALLPGPELRGSKGKVVRNLHTLNDPIWNIGHEVAAKE